MIPAGGYLRLSGDDRVAFLQRQTTNDLRLAQAGRAVLTVLTTPTARILDVLYVLPEEASLGADYPAGPRREHRPLFQKPDFLYG